MQNFNADPKKRLVALYIRVSTAEQKREGYSPENQLKNLMLFVESSLRFHTRPDLVFQDVGTGNDLNRADLERMRKLVRKKEIDGVVVIRIDRLSRNLKHLLMLFEEFQQHEVSFISMQENIDFTGPIGRLIFQIFGSLAQFERELIRGRTHAGKMMSAEMGNYTRADTPYGYDKIPNPNTKGKKLAINQTEKPWVETIYDWYVYKGWGDLKISTELNRRKVPIKSARKGKKAVWTEKRVMGLLTNSLYSGHFVAFTKDEEGKLLPIQEQTVVHVPPCISEVLFKQAQKVREARTGGRSLYPYLLSGKLMDVSPDIPKPRKFSGAPRTKGGHCYRRKAFKHPNTGNNQPNFEIPAAPLEDFVWEKIMTAFYNPAAFVQKYLNLHRQSEQVQEIESSLLSLRQRQTEIEGLELPNSEKAYLKGVFSEYRFTQIQIDLNKELKDINGQIAMFEQDLEGLAWVRTEAKNLKTASKELKGKIKSLTREQKKILCGLFIDRVEITRTERPNQKRLVEADIYFRFNLSRLGETLPGVCTASSSSQTTKNGSSNPSNDLIGGTGRSGEIATRISEPLLRAASQ